MNQGKFQMVEETLIKNVEIWMFLKTQKWFLIDADELGTLSLKKKIDLFIFGCTGLSLVAVTGGYSLLRVLGVINCSTWAQELWFEGFSTLAQPLWCTGLVAPWHVWDLRGPGIKPVSPALAGGFFNH